MGESDQTKKSNENENLLTQILDSNDDVEITKMKTAITQVMSVMLKISLQPIKEDIQKILFKTDNLEEDMKVVREDLDTAQESIRTLESRNEQLVMENIEQGVYARKKNLIVTGLPGVAKEPVQSTIQNVRKLFEEAFKFQLHDYQYSAIHRLNQDENAAIIVALTRLIDTNFVMENAKHLQDYNNKNKTKVAVQVQTHPAIKDIRHELLQERKLKPGQGYHVKSLPNFPFFGLFAKKKPTIYSGKSKSDVVDLFLKYVENKEKVVTKEKGDK